MWVNTGSLASASKGPNMLQTTPPARKEQRGKNERKSHSKKILFPGEYESFR